MSQPAPPDLLDIERAIALAWPADQRVDVGGWWWRASGGGFGRANSVATLGGPPADIDGALAEIERRYRDVGLPSLIQVTDAAVPADLAHQLIARGYAPDEPNATLRLDLAAAPPLPAPMPSESGDAIEVTADASAEWIEAYGAVLSQARKASAPRILARVPRPRRLIGIRRHGRIAATVLVTVTLPLAIIECVSTRAEIRRSGLARRAMLAAMGEARALDARIMALSMVSANAPARALYEGLGFVEVGTNRYFRKEM